MVPLGDICDVGDGPQGGAGRLPECPVVVGDFPQSSVGSCPQTVDLIAPMPVVHVLQALEH